MQHFIKNKCIANLQYM